MVKLDPITLEILTEGLISVVREMRATVFRTARSVAIYEGKDYSCALFDATGQVAAQSEDNGAHVVIRPLVYVSEDEARLRAMAPTLRSAAWITGCSESVVRSARAAFPEIEFERSVVIGDAESDMLAGRAIGARTFVVGQPPLPSLLDVARCIVSGTAP